MWAPADLFTSGVNPVLLDLKAGVSYFYERPVVLMGAVVVVAALIALVTVLMGRRERA